MTESITFKVQHSRSEPRTLKMPRDANGKLPTGLDLLTALLEYLGLQEPDLDEPGDNPPRRNQDTTWVLRNATQQCEVPLDGEARIAEGDMLEIHDRSIAGVFARRGAR